MKRVVEDFWKGAVIGLGMLAPGLSGGVFAVSLGVYPRIIGGLNEFLRHPLKTLRDLIWIGLGGVLGIALTYFALLQAIERLPLPFSFLFIGFLLGSLPEIRQKSQTMIPRWKSWALSGIAFLFFSSSVLWSGETTQSSDWSVRMGLLLFFAGIVLAGSLIIPGVSGSALMMGLGVYGFLLVSARDALRTLIDFRFDAMLASVVPLAVFGAGLILGILGFAKWMGHMLKRREPELYSAILGLLAAAPFAIVLESAQEFPDYWNNPGFTVPLGIVLMGFGMWGARRIARFEALHPSK